MFVLRGHKGRVCALAYSPDGKTLASGGEDKRIRLWDVSKGQERLVLKGHPACVYSVAFSPDGQSLASGGGRKSLLVWDLAGTQQPKNLIGHSVLVSSVAFASDGMALASAGGDVFTPGFDGEVVLWDTQHRQVIRLPVPAGVRSLALSPHGTEDTIAVGDGKQTVTLWNFATDARTSLEQGNAVRCVAFSPRGDTLAVATGWGVKLWDVRTAQLRATLKGHKEIVWSVAFLPSGQALVTGSEDRTVKVWDVASGQERATFDWQIGKIRAVACAPDGMTAAAAGDGDVVLWDVEEN